MSGHVYQPITDPDDIFQGCDAFTTEDPVLADLAYFSVPIKRGYIVVESHIVCLFKNQQDADAFDASHVYSGFKVFNHVESWMSLAAAEELFALVEAQTPTSVSHGPCVVTGAWCLFQDTHSKTLQGFHTWQRQEACKAAEMRASLAVACPFIRRFRVPATVLLRHIGIGCPTYQALSLVVALPRTMLPPCHMLHEHQDVLAHNYLPPPGNKAMTVPFPWAQVVPIVQVSGSVVQIPLQDHGFVAAVVDCCDITHAAILDVERMLSCPLHVHSTARHTIASLTEHLTWDVLKGTTDAYLPMAHYRSFVLMLQTEHVEVPRTIVFTMIIMNKLVSRDGCAGLAFSTSLFWDDIEHCSSVLHIRDDNDDRRLKVPSHLLRKRFDDAHATYIQVGAMRLAWMCACARAKPCHASA
jgi:hypothetical protein